MTADKTKTGHIRLAVCLILLGSCMILQAEASTRTVKGDGAGSWNFTTDSAQAVTAETASAATAEAAPAAVAAESTAAAAQEAQSAAAQTVPGISGVSVDVSGGPGEQAVFWFNGKKYVADIDWGSHYLTGFSPNADGSRRTRSGVDAKAGYTVSSTLANLGKVILIQAESGPGDFNRYDGIYKCEDTGGTAVEKGLDSTGNVPVVDIFFDTAEEASKVSDAGWITARIYILREVN